MSGQESLEDLAALFTSSRPSTDTIAEESEDDSLTSPAKSDKQEAEEQVEEPQSEEETEVAAAAEATHGSVPSSTLHYILRASFCLSFFLFFSLLRLVSNFLSVLSQ